MKKLYNANYKTETLNVGDTVFYLQPWTEIIQQGVIKNLTPDCAVIKGTFIPGEITLYRSQLFKSPSDAQKALRDKNTKTRNDYEATIKTVEDLVRFGFDHTVCRCEEYTDWEARAAYKNRAKQLLGIDLKD